MPPYRISIFDPTVVPGETNPWAFLDLPDVLISEPHTASSHTGSIFPLGVNQNLGTAYLDIKEISVPSNPDPDVRRIFVDSATGKLSVQTNGGQTLSLEEQGGSGSFSMTEVETSVGTKPRKNGRFQISGLSGLSVGKAVAVTQASGPYTGKGTRADEAEMDQVTAIGKVTSSSTIDVYWQARTRVRGNVKFNYVVSG